MDLSPRDKNNLLFYAVMCATKLLTNQSVPSVGHIAAVNLSTISKSLIDEAVEKVLKLYKDLGGSDQVAKGSQLLAALKK